MIMPIQFTTKYGYLVNYGNKKIEYATEEEAKEDFEEYLLEELAKIKEGTYNGNK